MVMQHKRTCIQSNLHHNAGVQLQHCTVGRRTEGLCQHELETQLIRIQKHHVLKTRLFNGETLNSTKPED